MLRQLKELNMLSLWMVGKHKMRSYFKKLLLFFAAILQVASGKNGSKAGWSFTVVLFSDIVGRFCIFFTQVKGIL